VLFCTVTSAEASHGKVDSFGPVPDDHTEAVEPSAPVEPSVIPLMSNTEEWIAAALQLLQDPNMDPNSVFAIPTNVLRDILSSYTSTAGVFRHAMWLFKLFLLFSSLCFDNCLA